MSDPFAPRPSIDEIPFGNRTIGPSRPVIVIAEIGVNHEGDADVCARMIEAAAEAGADSIKLQTMDAEENYVPGTESHALFSDCALSRAETARMFDLARRLGLEPFTTTGDFASIDWVDRLEPAAHKISSGLFTHLPMVRHAAASGRTLLMSTGMAEPVDIDRTVAAARAADATFGLFQCTSIYPAGPELLNLSTVGWLADRYRVPTGFSDHSVGIEAAALSVAAGACMIEKHFTFDARSPGYDHRLSLEPDRFAEMVRAVRQAETMRGKPVKELTEAERLNGLRNHRCLVARHPLKAGDLFTTESLGLKRPLPDRRGMSPEFYEQVLSRRVTRDLAVNEPVTADAVEGWP